MRVMGKHAEGRSFRWTAWSLRKQTASGFSNRLSGLHTTVGRMWVCRALRSSSLSGVVVRSCSQCEPELCALPLVVRPTTPGALIGARSPGRGALLRRHIRCVPLLLLLPACARGSHVSLCSVSPQLASPHLSLYSAAPAGRHPSLFLHTLF